MPKKLGVNTKAVEAKARKEAAKQAKLEIAERQKQDEFWKDEDKHIIRKQNRKEEKEKKKQDSAERKAMNKAVYEEEMNSFKSKKIPSESKVTRAEITTILEKNNEIKTQKKTVQEQSIQENVNRIIVEGEEARTIDEAIAILSTKEDDEADRHPERRMKAAYALFEEKNLPILKAENPNLRLSQLKQLLKKDWMKSPDNPLNQRSIAYNAKSK